MASGLSRSSPLSAPRHEERRLVRAAGLVGGMTSLSRVLGLLRETAMAYFFGAGAATDAFFVAFRIPNLLRQLLAEGTLTAAFIPVFSTALTQEGRAKAFRVAQASSALLAVVVLGVVAAGILAARPIVYLLAPGFAHDPEKFALTVLLLRIMFPFLLLVALTVLASGILNSLDRFGSPALAPVVLNAVIIAGIVWGGTTVHGLHAVAAALVVGGLLQLLLQVPTLRGEGVPLRPIWDPWNPWLKKMWLLFGPRVFGIGIYYLDVFVSMILASLLSDAAISYLWYAQRFFELPLGIFVVSVATAALPLLSRQAAEGKTEAFKGSYLLALRLVTFICLPATIGLIALSGPIVRVFLRHGAFDAAAGHATAVALSCYAVGLWAVAGSRITVQAFYALHDTWTPVRTGLVAFLVNAAVSLMLLKPLEHAGLALATGIASFVNVAQLVWYLRRKLGRMGLTQFVRSLGRSLAASAAMGLVLWGTALLWREPRHGAGEALWLGVMITLGVGGYVAAARLLGAEELRVVLGSFRRRPPAEAEAPAAES